MNVGYHKFWATRIRYRFFFCWFLLLSSWLTTIFTKIWTSSFFRVRKFIHKNVFIFVRTNIAKTGLDLSQMRIHLLSQPSSHINFFLHTMLCWLHQENTHMNSNTIKWAINFVLISFEAPTENHWIFALILLCFVAHVFWQQIGRPAGKRASWRCN